MSADETQLGAAEDELERHASLDDRFDPAVRIVGYDAAWPAMAGAELCRVKEARVGW